MCAAEERGDGGRAPSWYVSREEIERGSPSRRDGVSAAKEAWLRTTYCSFIRDVCLRLQLGLRPQITFATAIVLCHRFYLRQSHAKNEWQTVATVCIFLASKIEDTPCQLERVVTVAYETMYKKNPYAAKRIYQKEVLDRQKALILVGETLLLSTIRFDFNIQHPYEPLKLALNNLKISQKEVRQAAINLINDALATTLAVQFKPHYIAAGSLFLAAKFHNIRLSEEGQVWWHGFEVALGQLKAVIQQMTELFKKRDPCSMGSAIKPTPTSTPIDKQRILSAPVPASRHTQSSRIRNSDKEGSRFVPADRSVNYKSTGSSARTEENQTLRAQLNHTATIKPTSTLAPTPTPIDKQQIINTPAPARGHTQSSRISIRNSDAEGSRFVPVCRSLNNKSIGSSPRSEENQSLRAQLNHTTPIKPTSTPAPTPITPMGKQRGHTHSSRINIRNSDAEGSRFVPVDRSSNNKPTSCSARSEEHQSLRSHLNHTTTIKPTPFPAPTPTPIPVDKQRIKSTLDPALRHTPSSRTSIRNSDTEGSRCVHVDRWLKNKSTGSSERSEENQSLRTQLNQTATIKPTPTPALTPTPIPVDKHRIRSTPDPALRHTPSSRPITRNSNTEGSRRVHVARTLKSNSIGSSARNEENQSLGTRINHTIRPTPTPASITPVPNLMDKQRIMSIPDPALRHIQSSRTSIRNSNTEGSLCVPVDWSLNNKFTGSSARNEENQSLQTHINHSINIVSMDRRFGIQYSRRSLKGDRVYSVCSGAKDMNATRIRDLTRQKRRIQEVGGQPAPDDVSDKGAWIGRQLGSVIAVETDLSWKKQKVERG
ncbi:hypothetical protein ACP70R_028963 [Stipagrostis hirtigluma subsp. patula]